MKKVNVEVCIMEFWRSCESDLPGFERSVPMSAAYFCRPATLNIAVTQLSHAVWSDNVMVVAVNVS